MNEKIHHTPNLFDQEHDREGTSSIKWEFIQQGDDLLNWEHTDRFFGPDRILPMWVADMDFRCPDAVIEAILTRAEHGIFGYTAPTRPFYDSVAGWMERRHGWKIEADWICLTPGVVPALNMLVRAYTNPGGKVLIQPPVYYPFYGAVQNNEAQLVTNPLILENGHYRMDLEDLASTCSDPDVKMAILCSPHNPVGRVWTSEELEAFGQICVDNDIIIVSDEIHGDLIYPDYVFTPFAKLNQDFAQNSVICTAPSKTFNLAGLQTSCIIIPDPDLRAKFQNILQSNGLFGINVFGMVALQAAYDHGEPWLQQLLKYLDANLKYLESYIAENIPELEVIHPEGTYLVWIDCRKLGLDKQELRGLIFEKAKVYLDDGFIFGPEGDGFERINIACPRKLLVEALDRIKQAIGSL